MRLPTLRTALILLIGFGLIASLGCLAGAVSLGLTARTDAAERAVRRLTAQSNGFAREIEADLALFDLALREAAAPRDPGQPPPHVPLLELPLTARYVGFMNVLNEVGDVIADPRSNVSRPANFAGRDYFQGHLKTRSGDLMIGRPFGIAPNQHASIPISRRRNASDGGFAGVVVAGVRLTWLSDLLSQPSADSPPTITVRRDDGLILMRMPFDPDVIGRNGATDPAWQAWLSTGPSLINYDDGRVRLFRRVGTSPLVLELALNRAGIDAGERSWLIWLPSLALIPGLCVVALSLMASRLHRHGGAVEAAANAANDERMRVMATMSHELRTPLAGILGQADLMTGEGGLNDRQSARLARMTEAGTLMRTIVNRVIDVTRPTGPDAPPNRTRCDLDPFIRACAGMVETEATRKGLRLTTAIDPSTPGEATLARDLLQQVLVNLLMNAVKFTSRGLVTLRVSGDETGLRFEVADTGPGIPASKHRRLFRAYDRLDAPDSTAGGTGLGLSITERFVRRMGGRIGHTDNPGGGSVFWVELPTPEPDATNAGIIRDPPHEAVPETRSLRILLADDLDLTRSVTADYLRSAGHMVTEVPNGETAIETVQMRDFDVILTDMRMPVMDGLEATRRIRALPGPAGRTPVVLVSADLAALSQGRSGRTGVDLCLMKPFTRAELLTAVADAARLTAMPRHDVPGVPVPGASPALDATIVSDLTGMLGEVDFAMHREAAGRRIEALIDLLRRPDATESPTVRDAVHDLVGVSGMLGLTALASSLRRFDLAEDRAMPAAALRDAAEEAVRALCAERRPGPGC
jgi:signal transduction histidine kinase